MAAFAAVVLVLLGVIGAVVTARQPRNPIGWILCGIPLSLGLLILGSHLHWSIALDHPAGSRAAEAVAWPTSWIWIPAIVPAVTLFPLLFPSGRPVTPRWRRVAWVAIGSCPALFVGTAFAPGRVGVIGALGYVLMLGVTFAATASLVMRFRRSHGVERQQLKWVAAAAALFLVIFVFPTDQLAGLVVLNRTPVYGALTATAALTYLGSVLLLQLALSGITEGSRLVAASSTLGMAALFRPARARARIQEEVDRRFCRRRYDARRTLEGFSARLRDPVDLAALSRDLSGVVRETLQPAHVTLSLRERP